VAWAWRRPARRKASQHISPRSPPPSLAVRHGPTDFHPFDGPSGAQLRPQWEALHDKAETLWRPESRVVSQDGMGTIAEVQRAYCRHLAQACTTVRRTVSVLASDSSAVPAAPHQPGWIPSHSQELLNSRAESSRLPFDTAWASPSSPSMPPPCSAAAESPHTAQTPTKACDATPSLHKLRCAMTS
jgi:hypothetical protein